MSATNSSLSRDARTSSSFCAACSARRRSTDRTISANRATTSTASSAPAIATAVACSGASRALCTSMTAGAVRSAAPRSSGRTNPAGRAGWRLGWESARIDGCSAAAPQATYESSHRASSPEPLE